MSTFGDWTEDDSADTALPDGEALARLFVILCRQVTGDGNRPKTLDEVEATERAMLLFVFALVAARLRRELAGL